MIKPTSPLASSTIIAVSLGVTEPSCLANPSQVADRTKRLASVIPLMETLSNNSAILILLFAARDIRNVHEWHSNRGNGYSATRMKIVPNARCAAIQIGRADSRKRLADFGERRSSETSFESFTPGETDRKSVV